MQEMNLEIYSLAHLLFPHPKEKRDKAVPLIAEDIEILKTFPMAISNEMPFFRKKNGEPYGHQYLRKIWKQACANLGIEGVDLYGGTRHSSARALRKHFSPERIRRAVGSTTNAAFERYYKIEEEGAGGLLTDLSRTSYAPQKWTPENLQLIEYIVIIWRREGDSNPREGFWPPNRFRVDPVTTTSVSLRKGDLRAG